MMKEGKLPGEPVPWYKWLPLLLIGMSFGIFAWMLYEPVKDEMP